MIEFPSLRQVLLYAGLAIIACAGVILMPANSMRASAVTAADWRAGQIIDDQYFYNNNDMTVSQIQSFLNSKVPTCDTWGTQPSEYGGGTRAQYGTAHGYPPPYTCLKDYYENPTTHANNLNGNPIPSGGISAAQIIKSAADAYGINPKVLIVTLQKESSGPLVTDTWPFPFQYKNAMGYGCPDTAPCDAQYYGFYNQVTDAAWQFQTYKNNPANYRYKALQNNTISFSPTTSCNSSTVFISTTATAGLYNYTPYQPNQAALNAGYGTGDSCSAYGNRNFWLYYNDWFGSTLAPTYGWADVNQSVYTDLAMTIPANLNAVHAGDKLYVRIIAANTGTLPWTNTGSNPVRLGTWNPQDRSSLVCDDSWPSCNRPTALKENYVAPGQNGTFEFSMTVPDNQPSGTMTEGFDPVAEGVMWMAGGTNINLNVIPTYASSTTTQNSYTDSSKSTSLDLTKLLPGQTGYVTISAVNTGNITWTNTGSNPVRLGTWSPQDGKSDFCDPAWIGCSRAATLKESSVAPGQTGTFEFPITAPQIPGTYNSHFNLVADGLTWGSHTDITLHAVVNTPVYSWAISSQEAYQDSARTVSFPNTATLDMTAHQTAYVRLKVTNTGNMTWANAGNNPVRLGTWNPQDSKSSLCSSDWSNCSRAATLKEASVAPGQTGTFEFTLTAPGVNGSYQQRFNLVSEGNRWFDATSQAYTVNVAPPTYSWAISSQEAYQDSSRMISFPNTSWFTVTPSQTAYVRLKVTNTGNMTWTNNANNPLRLGTWNPQDGASSLCASGSWVTCNRAVTMIEPSVAPGQTGTFEFTLSAPTQKGLYSQRFNLVSEGVRWFNDTPQAYNVNVN